MTPMELALECKRIIESGLRFLTLVLPRECRGERARLAGRGSPMSQPILCWNGRGTVCHFDAVDVLAWLCANDAVKVVAVSPTAEKEVKP